MAQYLNVRQRKLGTIIIQTVHILQMIVQIQVHCPRVIFAWSIQITSNKPCPAVVPLHLCTNRGSYATLPPDIQYSVGIRQSFLLIRKHNTLLSRNRCKLPYDFTVLLFIYFTGRILFGEYYKNVFVSECLISLR